MRVVFIDEVQDYSLFQLAALKAGLETDMFTMVGDLAQGIHSYRSLTEWDSVLKLFPRATYATLQKSYRTTIEIMEEANQINELLNLDKAIPVIRHGDNVEYLEDYIFIDIIDKLKDKYNTIAIITKDQITANNIYNQYKEKVSLNLITSSNLSYESNINVLPSYLAKGLEFDSVIVIDDFDRNNKIDLKLLYVSMTRALHKLIIVKNKLSK